MRFNYKKLVAVGAATLSIAAVLTACSGKKSNTSVNKDTKHGIALITDGNGVDDHSFNQAAWSGFKDYGTEHGLKQGKGGYQYFESSSAAERSSSPSSQVLQRSIRSSRTVPSSGCSHRHP